MGGVQTKEKRFPNDNKVVEGLKYKVRVLQREVSEIMCMRENESQLYEQEMMVFAFKEAEWKKERTKLREEVKKLRKRVDEREDQNVEDDNNNNGETTVGDSYLMQQIREEQARRDEAIEKWKQLYFAIKVELDHLILRTNSGEGLCWKEEGGGVEEKLRAKEECIEVLEAKIALLEQQELRREREVDILKQSLKIMFHKKKAHA
ncbi:PREDICTED: ninein [Ipomoea nil]|uniref:ninein n=1 Tax=Ipomoea nil TaxID=35883 RepID=UPI000900D403|nr:PREDICTED: ninein [Ipomoea nil]